MRGLIKLSRLTHMVRAGQHRLKKHAPAMELQCITEGVARLVNDFHRSSHQEAEFLMAATFFTSPKSTDRLAQLWEALRADPVPPHPIAKGRMTAGKGFEMNMEPVLFPGMDKREPLGRRWKADLAKLFHSLLETVDAESPSPDNSISEKAFPESSMEAAHEAALSLSSPFHWEPKPTWVSAPVPSSPPFAKITDPRQFAPRPKIPLRPLHKQPFYRRFFFYLRRWLNRPRSGS